jgi:hypothetical protein
MRQVLRQSVVDFLEQLARRPERGRKSASHPDRL